MTQTTHYGCCCGGEGIFCDGCEEALPSILYFSSHTCDCVYDGGGMPIPIQLTYNSSGPNGVGWYSSTYDCGGNSMYYRLYCSGAGFSFDQYCNGGQAAGTATIVSCSPVELDVVGAYSADCCGPLVTGVITE